jgi:hypothetical protein
LRTDDDQGAARRQQRAGGIYGANRFAQRAEIQRDDDQLPVGGRRHFAQQAQVQRREPFLHAPRFVETTLVAAEKAVVSTIKIQCPAQHRGKGSRARAYFGDTQPAPLGQRAHGLVDLFTQANPDVDRELVAEHLAKQYGRRDLARPDVGKRQLTLPQQRQVRADAANRVGDVKVVRIVADQAVPDVLRLLYRFAGLRGINEPIALREVQQLLAVGRRGGHRRGRIVAGKRLDDEAAAQRIQQRIDFAGILALRLADSRVREACRQRGIQRLVGQPVVRQVRCRERAGYRTVLQVADLLGRAALQANAAEADILEQRDRLPRFVKDLELTADRVRCARQYPGTGVFRIAHAAAIAQMTDAGRHEGEALVIGNLVAHQLDDQLECVVQQRRMQVVLVDLGTHAGRQFEHRDDRRAFDPAVVDRLESGTIIEPGAGRQQPMAARGEVRLARRQRIERSRQAQRGGFAQDAGHGLQCPWAGHGVFAGLDRQLPVARIQCAA